MPYAKPALTFDEQLQLLQRRGLTVRDRDRALRWLEHVSYYRLSAYFLPFKNSERFRAGTDFTDIADLYIFDRKLRLHVMDAIERIEVALRTAITYQIAHTYGPFGHTDSANFTPRFNHARFMQNLATEKERALRASEPFVTHFRDNYPNEQYLPVWMATELLSFGSTSILYRGLLPDLRQHIAAPYGVDKRFLVSWFHSLTYIRNVCAHHKRLWNREMAIRPSLPSRRQALPYPVPNGGRIYAALIVLRHMLGVASPHAHWAAHLRQLLNDYPNASTQAMGFPPDWQTLPEWQ